MCLLGNDIGMLNQEGQNICIDIRLCKLHSVLIELLIGSNIGRDASGKFAFHALVEEVNNIVRIKG